MKRRRSTRSERERHATLLASILGARDRDHCPGARALVAYREGDDAGHLADLRARALRVVLISRFGRPLLSVAELAEREIAGPSRPASTRGPAWSKRWRAARPIVVPGFARALVESEQGEIVGWTRVMRDLRRPAKLEKFLRTKFEPGALRKVARLDDRERDLEKFLVSDAAGGRPLWVKSATLTSPETNASGRVRFSFGDEGDDDASTDERAHERVSRLARACLPVAGALAKSRSRMNLLARLAGGPVLLTQQIAYWNAPEGGALLHHDAFHEPSRTRQRGVCYVQLSGATIWLALSTRDLVRHARDLVARLAAGEAPWIVADCFGTAKRFAHVARRARSDSFLEAELTSPGCGVFARLVNDSPEFLAILVDAGHGWRLEAGDAIVLPNHGHRRTCLHAVWCAGKTPGAALSMAIRRARR